MPKKRTTLIAVASIAAVAIVTPTIASTPPPPRELAKVSFANKTAKRAKQIAREARGIARKANRKANAAGKRVGTVEAEAAALRAELDAATAKTARAAGTVSTVEEAQYVDLGGPRVTVTVPESGMIELSAQVTMSDGAVSVFEDGAQLQGQDPNAICDGPEGALLSFPSDPGLVIATPGSVSLGWCGSTAPPVPVVFQTTPGEHTYELRYADCGCDPGVDGTFSDRVLTVVPRP